MENWLRVAFDKLRLSGFGSNLVCSLVLSLSKDAHEGWI
jgi:hypothetical protein